MAKQNYIKKQEFEKMKKELDELKKQKKAGTADEEAQKRMTEIEEMIADAIVINDNQEILTQAGLDKMIAELDYLKSVRRAEVAEKLKEARGHGDLSENSEYDEAKDEKAKLEEKIEQLQDVIDHCVIVEEIDTTRVSIGSKVTVFCAETGKTINYSIVGASEVNALENMISDKSPIGAGLLGHQLGDKVSVTVPMGILTFEIKEISK